MIKKINKLLLIALPLLVSGNVFAMSKTEFNVNLKNNTDITDISKLNNAVKNLEFLKNFPDTLNGIPKVNVQININDEYKESRSNFNRTDCQIEINYTKDLNPLIFNNISTDLIIAVLHEIGHCALGGSILVEPIQWHSDLEISDKERETLAKRLKDKRDKAFKNLKEDRTCSAEKKCTPQEVFNIYPPMLTYHEIFADMWAVAKLKDINCSIGQQALEKLESFRIEGFIGNPQIAHQSFLSFYYIKENNECERKFDFDRLTFYTQKGFIDYLSNH